MCSRFAASWACDAQRLGEARAPSPARRPAPAVRCGRAGSRTVPAAALPSAPARVDHQHPVAGQVDSSTRGSEAEQRAGSGGGQAELGDRAADRVARRRPSSRAALVVDQGDPALGRRASAALRGPRAARPRGTRASGSARRRPCPWVCRRSRRLISYVPSAAERERRAAAARAAPAAGRQPAVDRARR